MVFYRFICGCFASINGLYHAMALCVFDCRLLGMKLALVL